jgi:AcrR family transcriptional regulator
MGIAERKEREKEEMRKAILDVAFEMFLKDGYTGTSLREIAKKIEYSPATIYLYYKDKEALFFDIQVKCFQQLVQSYRKVVEIKNPLERLREMGHVYMKHNMKNPQSFNLMFLHEAPMEAFKREDRMEKYGNAVGLLRETVRECIKEKLIKEKEEMIVRMQAWGLTHGLTTLFVRKSYDAMGLTKAEAEDWMKRSWDNYINGIKT